MKLETLFQQFGGKCFYCQRLCHLPVRRWQRHTKAYKDGVATRDHFFPQHAGGKNGENVVLACYACNMRKADAVPACSLQQFTDWKQQLVQKQGSGHDA